MNLSTEELGEKFFFKVVGKELGMSSLCFRTRLQKASTTTFHFVKLKLFLNHQHN